MGERRMGELVDRQMGGWMAKWFEGMYEGKETQTYVREQGAWKRAVGEVRGRRSGVVEVWVSETIGVLGERKKDEEKRERQELGNTRYKIVIECGKKDYT